MKRAILRSDAALAALVAGAARATFAAALVGGFVHDDHRQIVRNPLPSRSRASSGSCRDRDPDGAPYVLLHAAKPPLEQLQALWGGVVFAWVAWRTGSFLPAFLAHWGFAVAMDWLCFRQLP